MLLSLDSIYKIYNGKEVLHDVNFTIEDNDRIGLIGVNGSGKTTLLKIINGLENFDKTPDGKGAISKASNLTIGYLEQNACTFSDNSIREEMQKVFENLFELQEQMREIEEKMSKIDQKTSEYKELLNEYSSKSSFFEASEGYLIDVKINTVLNGMGFDKIPHDRNTGTLSGGEKTRLAIAKLLLESPNLLILDEPTNHLDFKTLIWLEDYLKSYKGALLIVSHDRYFLNKLCNRVFEIERGMLTTYKGDYSAFVVQKEMNNERQAKQYEQQQKQISSMQDYVDRNRARASTANMAKSRQKAIDRIELIEKPLSYIKTPKISLEYDVVPPKDILSVKNVDLIVGEGDGRKELLNDISFEIKRGEKVGIIGANGIGKSSLLKLIQGIIPHEKGKIDWCKNIKLSYFDQESAQLDFNNSVLEELHKRFPKMLEAQVRKVLGSVLLTGENVFKPVRVISGGERAKLCFAIMVLTRANVLILDEPTNHLDLTTKEILEKALQEFDGTIIFVSHDRYFLNRVSNRILDVKSDNISFYNGNYDNYIEQSQQLKQEEVKKPEQAPQKNNNNKSYRTKEQRSEDVKNKQRAKDIEKIIDELQKQSNLLEKDMQNPEVCADYELLSQKCTEFDELKRKIESLYEEWDALIF